MRGKGRDLFPKNLIVTALGICFLTVMGIKAKKGKWLLDGLKLEVDKKMSKIGSRKIDNWKNC